MDTTQKKKVGLIFGSILMLSAISVDLLQIAATLFYLVPPPFGEILGPSAGIMIDIFYVLALLLVLYLTSCLTSSTVLLIAIFFVVELIPLIQGFPSWTLAMWFGLIPLLNKGIAGVPLGGTAMKFVGYGQKAGVISKDGEVKMSGVTDLAKTALAGRQLPLLDAKAARTIPPPLPTQNRAAATASESNPDAKLIKDIQHAYSQNLIRGDNKSLEEITHAVMGNTGNTLNLQSKKQPEPENHLNLNSINRAA